MSVYLLAVTDFVYAAKVNQVYGIVVPGESAAVLGKYSTLGVEGAADQDIRLIERITAAIENGDRLHAAQKPATSRLGRLVAA